MPGLALQATSSDSSALAAAISAAVDAAVEAGGDYLSVRALALRSGALGSACCLLPQRGARLPLATEGGIHPPLARAPLPPIHRPRRCRA